MQFRRICSKICRTEGSRTAPPVEPPVPLPLLCFLLRKPVPTPSLPSKRPSSTALICSVMTLRIVALCLYLSIHNKQQGLANWKGIVRLFESLRLKQEQEPLIGHHRQLSVTLQQHCCYATQRKVSGEVSILKGLKHLKGAPSSTVHWLSWCLSSCHFCEGGVRKSNNITVVFSILGDQ